VLVTSTVVASEEVVSDLLCLVRTELDRLDLSGLVQAWPEDGCLRIGVTCSLFIGRVEAVRKCMPHAVPEYAERPMRWVSVLWGKRSHAVRHVSIVSPARCGVLNIWVTWRFAKATYLLNHDVTRVLWRWVLRAHVPLLLHVYNWFPRALFSPYACSPARLRFPDTKAGEPHTNIYLMAAVSGELVAHFSDIWKFKTPDPDEVHRRALEGNENVERALQNIAPPAVWIRMKPRGLPMMVRAAPLPSLSGESRLDVLVSVAELCLFACSCRVCDCGMLPACGAVSRPHLPDSSTRFSRTIPRWAPTSVKASCVQQYTSPKTACAKCLGTGTQVASGRATVYFSLRSCGSLLTFERGPCGPSTVCQPRL
jgi:hypothetical protein